MGLKNVEYVGICGGDILFVSFIINGMGIEVDMDGFRKESFFVVFFCGENGKAVKIKGVSVSQSVFRKRGLYFTFGYVGYMLFEASMNGIFGLTNVGTIAIRGGTWYAIYHVVFFLEGNRVFEVSVHIAEFMGGG